MRWQLCVCECFCVCVTNRLQTAGAHRGKPAVQPAIPKRARHSPKSAIGLGFWLCPAVLPLGCVAQHRCISGGASAEAYPLNAPTHGIKHTHPLLPAPAGCPTSPHPHPPATEQPSAGLGHYHHVGLNSLATPCRWSRRSSRRSACPAAHATAPGLRPLGASQDVHLWLPYKRGLALRPLARRRKIRPPPKCR